MRRFRRATRTGIVVTGALALLMVYPGASQGQSTPDPVDSALRLSRERVEAINNANDVPHVTQNLIPGTIEARDLAIKQFKAAVNPPADSKPEYAVIWAVKSNIGDMSGNDTMRFINQGSISPTGLINVGKAQWVGGSTP
jgi:hypothetical protein